MEKNENCWRKVLRVLPLHSGGSKNWLQREKIKCVPNCPKWWENWTTNFVGIVNPPRPTSIVAAPPKNLLQMGNTKCVEIAQLRENWSKKDLGTYKKMTLACLASQSYELGQAQSQLVIKSLVLDCAADKEMSFNDIWWHNYQNIYFMHLWCIELCAPPVHA